MADSPLDRLHRLPCDSKVLYTMTLLVLGVGYLFAMMQVFEVHAGRDGKPGLSTTDLVIAYSGSHADTRLEAALKGPMRDRLTAEEREVIFDWINTGGRAIYRGGGREAYEQIVKPIIEKRCIACHGGHNPHIPNLSTFEGVSSVVEKDTGMDIFRLIRVSHIHLFGLTFIFFVISAIFVRARVSPLWLKCTIIATPFVTILLDIASWYLTKLYTGFAWVVMIGGILMGLTFAAQWLVSMYQLWLYRELP
ncbi:MAG: hypothetical protein PVI91_13360 [Gammaproteobacteria bacterium]|jgi:hypothetical protein